MQQTRNAHFPPRALSSTRQNEGGKAFPCRLQNTLAHHCAPVLLRKKASALFSVKAGEGSERAAEELLLTQGIALKHMGTRRQRSLLFAYEPRLLAEALAHPAARRCLARLGYPLGEGLGPVLEQLERRMQAAEMFPHEVGFFLGYPPADVVGFMLYGGRHCKHCCQWKVYGSVEKARQLCREYDECRSACRRHMEQGGDFGSLACMIEQAG